MKNLHYNPADRFEVPSKNILDLRNPLPAPPPRPRHDTLETFWKRRPTAPRARSSRDNAQQLRRMIGGFMMQLRAYTYRFRIGAFPIIALAMLGVFSAVAVIGQLVTTSRDVTMTARRGLESLKIASAQAASLDLGSARASFESAAESFRTAQESFDQINPFVARTVTALPIAGSKLSSAQHLVKAAEHIARAGSRFSTLASPLSLREGQGFSTVATLLEGVDNDRASLNAAVDEVAKAVAELERVHAKDLPETYRPQIAAVQQVLPALSKSLANLSDGTAVLAELFGVDTPSEYLYVFQNSNELRPTGGFMGSFALIRFDKGAMKLLDAPARGTYDIDRFLPETISPPLPLQVVTSSWYFRDANWYPDYPTTARQLIAMYQRARGFSPDGVVAFTDGLIARLLEATGPIDMTAYGVTVDAANFVTIAQEQAQKNYDLRVNDPKQFIVDLIPILTDRIGALDASKYPVLLAAFAEGISSGDFQMWSSHEETQARIVTLAWSGQVPGTSGDFFELVDTNIGGGKTDGVISEHLRNRTIIQSDGTVAVSVTVTRTHNGTAGDSFTSSRNRTYHRFYVPRGSTFVSAEGFAKIDAGAYRTLPEYSEPDDLLTKVEGRVVLDERSGTRINDEFDKTVFGNWTELDPGQTATFTVTYLLPFKVNGTLERYDLTLGRQAGSKHRTLEYTVTLPEGWKIAWSSADGKSASTNTLSFSTELDMPRTLSFVIRH